MFPQHPPGRVMQSLEGRETRLAQPEPGVPARCEDPLHDLFPSCCDSSRFSHASEGRIERGRSVMAELLR